MIFSLKTGGKKLWLDGSHLVGFQGISSPKTENKRISLEKWTTCSEAVIPFYPFEPGPLPSKRQLTCVAKARDIEHTLLQSSTQNAADQHLGCFGRRRYMFSNFPNRGFPSWVFPGKRPWLGVSVDSTTRVMLWSRQLWVFFLQSLELQPPRQPSALAGSPKTLAPFYTCCFFAQETSTVGYLSFTNCRSPLCAFKTLHLLKMTTLWCFKLRDTIHDGYSNNDIP